MAERILVAARDVAIRRGGRDVIHEATFELGPGVWALRGDNGSGKSTLLRALAGVGPAHRGTIAIAGHDLRREPVAARRRLGWLPQSAEIFGWLRAREFLETVAALRNTSADEPLARARRLIDDRCGDRRIDTLSAGQRRKLCLCAALCGRPDVLLLDEPEAALDESALADLATELAALAHDGRAIIVAAHGGLAGVDLRGTLLAKDGRVALEET
jgi:ABC-type multidrug transport system ATPase subunit